MQLTNLILAMTFCFVSSINLLGQKDLTLKDIQLTINDISKNIREGYIYEDQGNEISELLLKRFNEGEFNLIEDKKELINQLNKVLKDLSSDPHLYLRSSDIISNAEGHSTVPISSQGMNLRRRVKRSSINNISESGQRGRIVVPPIDNFGFERVEILEGNIGYLKFKLFSPEKGAILAADSAMKFLSNTDKIIIDLRLNMGGTPDLVVHLSSYLFDNPTHLTTAYQRGWDNVRERWTYKIDEGEIFSKKPVYILMSKRTFSAAESFVFGLKNNDRVVTIGESTGGGGHFGSIVDIHNHIQMFLPQGRVWDPKTGEGFQSTGILPDYEVRQEQALNKALELARSIE